MSAKKKKGKIESATKKLKTSKQEMKATEQ